MSKISKYSTYSVTDHEGGNIVIEANGMELYINLNDGTLTTFNAEQEETEEAGSGCIFCNQ